MNKLQMRKKHIVIAGLMVLQLQLVPEVSHAMDLNIKIRCKELMNSAIKLMSKDTSLMSQSDEKLLKKLDQVNRTYFDILYGQKVNSKNNDILTIADDSARLLKPGTKAYPTAIASKDLMKSIDVYHYADLDDDYLEAANDVALWMKKMHAGTGSSVTRKTFLSEVLGVNVENIVIGAKGTDLYAPINIDVEGGTTYVSLAEIQLLQLYHLVNRTGNKMEVIVQDIVGPETSKSLKKLWGQPSLINSKLTYGELFDTHPLLSRNGETFQSHIPTLGADGKLTNKRVAPGGHALFAVDGLLASYKKEMRPNSSKSKTLISAIANGEDLSGRPDPKMLGLMKKKKIAIAMVTTTKTTNDLKGGQIAIVKRADGTIYSTIIEKAQAEVANQLKLFQELGLREGDEIAFFNTNMALINYEVLTPLIEKLISDVGESEFMKIISPDLILNNKSQLDAEGIKQTFTQLEGAMGSVLLNLDKYWRDNYGSSLVSFINVDSKKRTNFFAPIKTAFDFFMQFYSDRFTLDQANMILHNNRPESLPSATFADGFFDDTKNVLDSFKNTSIIELDSLNISKGKVNLSMMKLKGDIEIINESDEIISLEKGLLKLILNNQGSSNGTSIIDGQVVLEDCKILIDKKFTISVIKN